MPAAIQSKRCSGCKAEKSLAEFTWVRSRGRHEARCKGCRAEAAATYRAANVPRYRDHRVKRYGITQADYAELLVEQGGVCAICLEPPGSKSLHVDHDHHTGRIRGLLCFRCNVGLGYFRDRLDLLDAALEYLR